MALYLWHATKHVDRPSRRRRLLAVMYARSVDRPSRHRRQTLLTPMPMRFIAALRSKRPSAFLQEPRRNRIPVTVGSRAVVFVMYG